MTNRKNRPSGRPRSAQRTTTAKTKPGRTGRASTKRHPSKATRGRQQGGLSTNAKITIGMLVFAVVAIGTMIFVSRQSEPSAADVDKRLVRSDSHTLSTAKDGKATLVEFLDFECEACGALFPDMEKLRDEYDGKFTFVVRYFPLPSHKNSELAARSVESAAEQGKFEEMYKKMYENQKEWGEKQESQEKLFLGFAEELGLDMKKFKSTLNDPATAKRVQKDVTDGTELGVSSTPTIYFNGERVEQPSYDTVKQAIDEALAT